MHQYWFSDILTWSFFRTGREQSDRQSFSIHADDEKLFAVLWSEFRCNSSSAKCNRQPKYDWKGETKTHHISSDITLCNLLYPFLSSMEAFTKFCSNYTYKYFRISLPQGVIPSLCWDMTGFQQATGVLHSLISACSADLPLPDTASMQINRLQFKCHYSNTTKFHNMVIIYYLKVHNIWCKFCSVFFGFCELYDVCIHIPIFRTWCTLYRHVYLLLQFSWLNTWN